MDKLGILVGIGDQIVSEVLVNGEDAVKTVSKMTGVDLDPATATGNDCLRAMENLDVLERAEFLSRKPDVQYRNEIDTDRIAEIVTHIRGRQSAWKTAVAVFMALLVGIVVIDYAVLMYVATTGRLELPSWQDVTFIIIVPGGIVWAWFGVLTKENRDLLTATIGELPAAGPMGAILKAFMGRRTGAPKQAPSDYSAQSGPTGGQQQSKRPTGRSAASDDVDDNPPPGAAM
jgi:hypothetical protein